MKSLETSNPSQGPGHLLSGARSTKTIGIVQSNYIPWKGYFDLINSVDEFILYDDAQYTKNDWRNRNMIKTPLGAQWITVPILIKGRFPQPINKAEVNGMHWAQVHWKTLQTYYAKAAYFQEYGPVFKDFFLNLNETLLSSINHRLLVLICGILGIRTKISFSTQFEKIDGPTENLINLCRQTGAQEYLSGPAAKSYIDENLFAKNNIQLKWMDYSGYPEYRQLHPPFVHTVSILDLLFNEGPNAPRFMKSFSGQ